MFDSEPIQRFVPQCWQVFLPNISGANKFRGLANLAVQNFALKYLYISCKDKYFISY